MFDKGRRGEFGKVYGKLDVMTLNEWARIYFDMKYAIVEQQHKQEKTHFEKAGVLSASLHKQITDTDGPKQTTKDTGNT